ncbi:replication initiator protein [Sigmofec virus UA08Rod_7382]|uniref:Replication initiator protein n=1 Tax=Sigmofec virus UA08Rod_7382 TaxID=2929246 RepID=A0A976N0R4_9VIRU|nr:replication initiator protein [Sigmofec virus UA08Rod_7382]
MLKCSHPKIINGRICSCGQCINCRKQRINDWYIRMLHHALSFGFDNCCYVTLTYNDSNLPCPEVGGVLVKKDYQNFLKRLRRRLERKGFDSHFQYFIAGEYGSQFKRPHFHIIFFGLSPKHEQLILDSWNKGFICLKPLEKRNFRYVSKYCVKNFNDYKVDSNGEIFPEFTEMSRRETIGYSYVKSNLDYVFTSFYKDGKFYYRIPRAYSKKFKEDFGFSLCKNKMLVFYNDSRFSNVSDVDFNNSFNSYVDNIWKEDTSVQEFFRKDTGYNYKSLADKVEILPFSSFLNQVQVNSQVERDWFLKIKKDYSEYTNWMQSRLIYGSISSCHSFFYDCFDFIYLLI